MFSVNEQNIHRWRQSCDVIFHCEQDWLAFWGPKKGFHPEVEEVVTKFVKDRWANGLAVTRRILQEKALTEVRARGVENFVASDGWCTRFMRRYRFSLRCWTLICQKLPPQFEEKLINFKRYVIALDWSTPLRCYWKRRREPSVFWYASKLYGR